MRSKTMVFAWLALFLLASGGHVQGNELQRLVFNAAGNIGMTSAVVEIQGITPENSPTLNRNINTAITMLNQLISQYNDPPFDADQIRKIVAMLQRFPQSAERLNNQQQANYLENCYTNLKTAMSTIFRSDQGLQNFPTCDTFVADLGYYCGQAMMGIQLNNKFLENSGKSRINMALSSGSRVRNTLGCSFLTDEQARNLNVPNLKTAAEFTEMVRGLENIVRVASLNLEPGFDSPATKGTLPSAQRIDPPPVNPPVSANDLTGSWKEGEIRISREGGNYVARAYFKDVPNYYRQAGYQEGMVILQFSERPDASGYYYGKHFLFLYGEPGIYVDAVIEHQVNANTNRDMLKVHYTYQNRKSSVIHSRFRR